MEKFFFFFLLSHGYSFAGARRIEGDIAYCYFERYFVCTAGMRDFQSYGRSFNGKKQKHNSHVMNDDLMVVGIQAQQKIKFDAPNCFDN